MKERPGDQNDCVQLGLKEKQIYNSFKKFVKSDTKSKSFIGQSFLSNKTRANAKIY